MKLTLLLANHLSCKCLHDSGWGRGQLMNSSNWLVHRLTADLLISIVVCVYT